MCVKDISLAFVIFNTHRHNHLNNAITHNNTFYKKFEKYEQIYSNLTSTERFYREIDSLCRLKNSACHENFPEIIAYDSKEQILATQISIHSGKMNISEQITCMYDCMKEKGIFHTDLHCKNTIFKNGYLIILDFETATTPLYNKTIATPLFNKLKRTHTARNREDFKKKMLKCVQLNYR